MSYENQARRVSATVENEVGAEYGDEYLEWKVWKPEEFGQLSKYQEAYFSAQMKMTKTAFPPQSRVLEIGFGNGSFLAYGAKRQWEMHGTEANIALVKQAQQKGFHAVHTNTLKGFPNGYFDLVLAFDVLEHIPQDRLLAFLRDVQRILRDKGIFAARFPNGDSPFGRYYQHGDPTHVTTIGSGKAKYFAGKLDVAIIHLGAEAEPLWADLTHFAHRIFAVPAIRLLNTFLNLFFFPGCPKALCSLNLILIFQTEISSPGTK